MKKLKEKAISIFEDNRKKGFWEKNRTLEDVSELIISEVAEALEGKRKGLQDDHLKEYPMECVEIADTVIRCFDAIGGWMNGRIPSVLSCDDFLKGAEMSYDKLNLDNIYINLNVDCSRFMDIFQQICSACKEHTALGFLEVIKMCQFYFNENFPAYNLEEVINKKLAYNKNRPYKHGKKF